MDHVIFQYLNKIEISQTGLDSDQFEIKLNHTNKNIAIKYINQLIYVFDNDGIEDRQLEYKRTMDLSKIDHFFSDELELELKSKHLKKTII